MKDTTLSPEELCKQRVMDGVLACGQQTLVQAATKALSLDAPSLVRVESWRFVPLQKVYEVPSWQTCLCPPTKRVCVVGDAQRSSYQKESLTEYRSTIQGDRDDMFRVYTDAVTPNRMVVTIQTTPHTEQEVHIVTKACCQKKEGIYALDVQVVVSGGGKVRVFFEGEDTHRTSAFLFSFQVKEDTHAEIELGLESPSGKPCFFWHEIELGARAVCHIRGVFASMYWRREVFRASLAEQAEIDMRFLPVGERDAVISMVTDILHAGEESQSRVLLRGLFQKQALGVAHISTHIDQKASKSRAMQEVRGLSGPEGGALVVKPHLRILSKEVSCTHAATFGPLSLEAIQSMEARGIPRVVATKLLTKAFFAPILEGFSSQNQAAIRERLDACI